MTCPAPSGHDRAWVPTATKSQRAAIYPILETIADACPRMVAEQSTIRPHYLAAAMFLGYLSLHPRFRDRRDQAEVMFSHAVERASESVGASLFGGYVELGWYAAHLGQLLGWDVSELCDDIDQLTIQALEAGRPSEFDLIRGLVGIGVYGLERRSRPILTSVLSHLEAMASRRPTGLAWANPSTYHALPDQERTKEGNFDCGMAHGTPGVIGLLAGMLANGIEPDRVSTLLYGATDWVLSVRQPSSSEGLLPTWVPGSQQPPQEPQTTRIAWCYGDLGASIALFSAAACLKNQSFLKFGSELGLNAAERPFENSGVLDAGLCHGSAGNAHVFGRLFQLTCDRIFLDISRRYLEMSIAMFNPNTGFGGFEPYGSPGAVGTHTGEDRSFLGGAFGIGLSLLAASSSRDPAWDRTLLLSFNDSGKKSS